METYVYILTAAGGFAIGTLMAYLNCLISKKTIGSNNMSAIMGANFARLGIDAVTLLAVFLVCRHFGFSVPVAILATALGLSVCGMLFLKRLTKIINVDNDDNQDGGE